jgi:hypothetical protein
MNTTHTISDKVAVIEVTLKDSKAVLILVAAHTDVGTRSTPQGAQVKRALFAQGPHD